MKCYLHNLFYKSQVYKTALRNGVVLVWLGEGETNVSGDGWWSMDMSYVKLLGYDVERGKGKKISPLFAIKHSIIVCCQHHKIIFETRVDTALEIVRPIVDFLSLH